jgi:hypothetical protein
MDRAAEAQAWLESRADEMAALLESSSSPSTPRTRPVAGSAGADASCTTRWSGWTFRPS